MSEMEVISLQTGCKGGVCSFGVWRSAKGAPVERCLACEADAVGSRQIVVKGLDDVCTRAPGGEPLRRLA